MTLEKQVYGVQSLTLPLPTSVNKIHANSQFGRIKTQAYRKWIDEAGWEIKANLKKFKNLNIGWYRTKFFWPAEDSADADNRTKALHDLLVKMRVTPDDKWLWGSSQERSWSVKPGTCYLEFWNVSNDETKAPLGT